ncbi:carbon-phosphorus lyase complex subunit PhnI [Leptothrix discophora]|uniref:Carbon-phosphorus lyase complex subunit PhnI n=1 Tax=Leptothrix discophora TaxID=89 RepID=A0ABT9G6K2_LEPDI|nr:carbon-phosphorus lyase complex subunit PhnI [Leptothrix discophora]MDP4302089.1 carbon-phosphorus lyase complex subunit PhnI [Leptothrix discophora]
MYVAVKGGAAAIAAAERLLAAARRGDPAVREIEVRQIREQLGLLVDRVMAEGSLHDPELAALALKQARGDAVEAVFLLRAYRTTLPRLGSSEPLAMTRMATRRRVSAIFKDLPGGQLLGPTVDYTQRLIDFGLLDVGSHVEPVAAPSGELAEPVGAGREPCALDPLAAEGVIEPVQPSPGDPLPPDITREPPIHPLGRPARLQMLARADEGWLLGMAYSTQRGYANSHPFAGEIRVGRVPVELVPDELGFPIEIGAVELTECQMLNQFAGSASAPPQFTRGYGLVLGHGERKAMAMSLVDRALRGAEFGELPQAGAAAQDAEFVLAHGDNVEASGFVQHLKLPHHVTFESELQLVRALREEFRDEPA